LWNIRVEDSVDSPPYTVVDDIIVILRTPRSHDFVTVEVGHVCDAHLLPSSESAPTVMRTSRPAPWLSNGWCGEVHVGLDHAVAFDLSGEEYRLGLEQIDTSTWRLPWGTYAFRLERETLPALVGVR
jgi:hypothetical protein